ncbi:MULTISPECIES: glycerol-3-phosphate 1-O-acyltransferase PlsY [Turicibacter]|jgi:acyl-phosphate glycerol 3-phosphate acyltransferase|uniref:Glycerol-3-phosphate acyltransferase n=2 Tax=Turicibacter sanguinis TaxID=154288 RepID=A0A9X4XBH2_9FIRM|nr:MULTISPECIES: glycerol-3-phosphate 1-O-acyltransferase PlsY [Turicibacter]EFF63093.1 acyl-phosphate glycerol 3-phosphate acyltransferase [Turicibacter sanguinis PC909]EGC91719.1 acyl-phosphate glycerol 3-phosphate acyltransferase [Turicibacter sp. HGF1]MBP3904171.1 glycerol-3-phosphate 1-O-acyltransferase PlsY [Turicibacter sp.]MCU7190998.1 glycerol-3-phosphate 1-O-acyltransferase PlsY [Turicibacter sanguinis]MCU7197093.1 glycerol-3-phosphate 1-O-acyltransferase PlsY [Turicibacter sanguinis
MINFILIIAAYLLGSFPSALVIGKTFYQKDIRQYGSGNLGSTNAFRVLGKKGGTIVFILDVLKGGLAVLAAMYLGATIHPLIISMFALIGHIYPIFANFKGGKAVATSAGIILFYSPLLFITLFIIFVISLKIWKMVSLSSTIISIAAVLIVWFGHYDLTAKIMFTLFAAMIIIKHIPNYKRILNGTENKVSF